MALIILTDSTADIRGAEAKKLNLELIPLNVTFGTKEYQDGVNLLPDEFYSLLKSSPDFPRTSQPSPALFLEIFTKAKERGDELLYLGLSSGLSGTFQSATIAKDQLGYKGIHLLDTLTSIQGLNLMVKTALKRREEGVELAKIIEEMEYMKNHLRILSAIDTLTYLKKGGRLSSAAAFIGNIIGLKVMVDLDKEGKIRVYGKCIGGRVAQRFLTFDLKNAKVDERYPLSFGYTDNPDNMKAYQEKAKDLLGEKEPLMSQIGPAIGSHIGPGGYDVAFISLNERK